MPTLTSTYKWAVWCADSSIERAADVERRKDGNFVHHSKQRIQNVIKRVQLARYTSCTSRASLRGALQMSIRPWASLSRVPPQTANGSTNGRCTSHRLQLWGGAAKPSAGASDFHARSTMLRQSTGTVCQSRMAQSVALGDSHGSVALGAPQQQHPPPCSSAASSSAKKMAPIHIPSVSGELVADLEGDVRSTLSESCIDGARRDLCVTGVGWSIQAEDEGPGADGHCVPGAVQPVGRAVDLHEPVRVIHGTLSLLIPV